MLIQSIFFSAVDLFTKTATSFTTESQTNLAAASINKVNNYLANKRSADRKVIRRGVADELDKFCQETEQERVNDRRSRNRSEKALLEDEMEKIFVSTSGAREGFDWLTLIVANLVAQFVSRCL